MYQLVLDILQKPKKSFKDLKQILKFIKQAGLNIPDLILKTGQELISKHKKQLGNDYYKLLEDIFYASINTENYEISDGCMNVLFKKFGKTDRILKMHACFNESRGNNDKATKIYEQLMSEHLLDYQSMKKLISIQRNQGNNKKAVGLINTYLQSNPIDQEAWMELADIYIEFGLYIKAQYCFDQLVILDPNNLNYVLLLAEIYQTLGGQSNIQTAKNYYCYILVQNNRNLRALWALFQILINNNEDKDNQQLQIYVQKHIKTIYQQNDKDELITNLNL